MNIILQHNPKTAGKSIRRVLLQNKLAKRANRRHSPMWKGASKNPKNYVIAVKRCPYDRAVSAFYHIKQNHPWFRMTFGVDREVNEFYHAILDNPKDFARYTRRFPHFRPQMRFLKNRHNNEVSGKINSLLRFEHLNEDWLAMKNELIGANPAWEKAPDSINAHVNKSPRKGSWKDELDDKAIDAINQFYSLDFEKLGYEMVKK